MKNCSFCSAELKFLNTPLLGAGKLNDGGVLCTRCCNKLGVTVNVKKLSLADVQQLMDKKMMSPEDKKLQAEEKKINDDNEKRLKEERKLAAEAEMKIKVAEKKALEDEQKKLKSEQKNAEMQNRWNELKAEKDQKKERLDQIKVTIQDLKLDHLSSFFGRKEINELPEILAPDEKIDNIIQGVYNNGQGILVSTNRRLVFIDKGLLYGIKVEDFPLDKISSIQYETGLLFAKVKIHTTGNIASIEQVDKSAARKFAEFVRDKLSRPKEQVVVQVASQPDVLAQLEKLGQLKSSGILSDDEFAEQKKKLLEKL